MNEKTWEMDAEATAHLRAGNRKPEARVYFASGFLQGAYWARQHLRDDNVIMAVAQKLFEQDDEDGDIELSPRKWEMIQQASEIMNVVAYIPEAEEDEEGEDNG